MKITLIWIGKTKDQPIKELIEEYEKRLGPYVLLDIKEKKESKKDDMISVMREEAETLLGAHGDGAYRILLDREGKQFSSVDFAHSILEQRKNESRPVEIYIGGHFGVDDTVKKSMDLIMSVSKMTLTHQMIRPILLEQIYRAMTIIHGKSYHL